jgi:hypothetical protein
MRSDIIEADNTFIIQPAAKPNDARKEALLKYSKAP